MCPQQRGNSGVTPPYFAVGGWHRGCSSHLHAVICKRIPREEALMDEKNRNERLDFAKPKVTSKDLEKEFTKDHFPEKSYEDDLDETDRSEKVQEEIRHSNHRF